MDMDIRKRGDLNDLGMGKFLARMPQSHLTEKTVPPKFWENGAGLVWFSLQSNHVNPFSVVNVNIKEAIDWAKVRMNEKYTIIN